MIFLEEFHGSDAVRLTASPDDVFSALVDVERLPEWNARVHHLIEGAGTPLGEGGEWVVQMRASGGRWPSRSRALVVDPVAHRFEYESRSDDGNPTSALWSWQVTPVDGGSELTVAWAVYPRTWGRRLLGARIRRPALVTEVRTSLAGLDAHLRPSPAVTPPVTRRGAGRTSPNADPAPIPATGQTRPLLGRPEAGTLLRPSASPDRRHRTRGASVLRGARETTPGKESS